jgi:hypothetical protein
VTSGRNVALARPGEVAYCFFEVASVDVRDEADSLYGSMSGCECKPDRGSHQAKVEPPTFQDSVQL